MHEAHAKALNELICDIAQLNMEVTWLRSSECANILQTVLDSLPPETVLTRVRKGTYFEIAVALPVNTYKDLTSIMTCCSECMGEYNPGDWTELHTPESAKRTFSMVCWVREEMVMVQLTAIPRDPSLCQVVITHTTKQKRMQVVEVEVETPVYAVICPEDQSTPS